MLQDSIIMLDSSDADNLAIVGGTSFPGTTHVGELFFRTDENKLYIRNAADDGWVDLAGAGGGSATDTATRRLQTDSSDNSFVEEHVWRASNQYAGYTTIATIAPNAVSGGTFTSGFVYMEAIGVTNSVGVGSRSARWWYAYNAGVLTVGSLFDEQSNASAPQLRLSTSGDDVLVQVRGSGGVQTMSGSIYAQIFVPSTSGGATSWTVTYT